MMKASYKKKEGKKLSRIHTFSVESLPLANLSIELYTHSTHIHILNPDTSSKKEEEKNMFFWTYDLL